MKFGSSIKQIQRIDKFQNEIGDSERLKFILSNSFEGDKIRLIYGECTRIETIKEVLAKKRHVDLLCGPDINPQNDEILKELRIQYWNTFRMFQYKNKKRPRNHAVVMRNSFFIEEPHIKNKPWNYALLLSHLHDDLTAPFNKRFDEDIKLHCQRISASTLKIRSDESQPNGGRGCEKRVVDPVRDDFIDRKYNQLIVPVLVVAAILICISILSTIPIPQSLTYEMDPGTITLNDFVPSLIVVGIGASLLVFNLLNLMVTEVWDVHQKNRCLQSALLKLPFLDIDSCIHEGDCKKGVGYIIYYSTEPITQQIKVIALSAISLFILSEFSIIGYLGFKNANLIILSFAFFISAIFIISLIVADMLILELKYYYNVQKGHRVMKKNSKLPIDDKQSHSNPQTKFV
ncbi:MAG: hypothetical protein M0Q91_15845 [Methanoregula sp.]|nr:hypothetical protein [Methanoregula sp.]